MKSIFKKIAFVLALAMVVTMMPAKAASAASSKEPQMYGTLKLYLGGDVTGSYEGQNYAKVWNKDNYTVTFASDNEEVATVNGKGFVRAVAVGTANITARKSGMHCMPSALLSSQTSQQPYIPFSR